MAKNNFRKILILELWGIGDVVMMSSILQPLRRAFPSTEISILCQQHGEEVLKNSEIDKFFIFNFPWTVFKGKYCFWRWNWRGLIKFIINLRKERFDLILDARGDFRNNVLSFLIGAKRRIGYNWTGGGYFLTDIAKFDYRNKHRVDNWTNLLAYLGVKDKNLKPMIYISAQEKKWADNFFKEHNFLNGKPLVGIHPGARIKTRCWSLEKFTKVAECIQKEYLAKIVVFIEPNNYGYNIVLKGGYLKLQLTLRKLIALISKLDLLICNDGGAMHIATAVNTPVLAIFGPTNPVWFGPYGNKHAIIIRENVSCRPCFDYCKYDKSYCLISITVDEVFLKVKKNLNNLLLKKSKNKTEV